MTGRERPKAVAQPGFVRTRLAIPRDDFNLAIDDINITGYDRHARSRFKYPVLNTENMVVEQKAPGGMNRC
jgi:hypothetical protein